MSEAMVKLATWLSPAYPVGAFSYSHGLEAAITEGAVTDAASLTDWIADALRFGAGRTDAILLVAAHRAPDDEEIAALAEALAPSSERLLETAAQGAAFAETTAAAWGPATLAPAAYPVAVGRAAAAHGVPAGEAARHYLQAFAANLISVGVRVVPIGQIAGQRVLAALSETCRMVAEEALVAELDAIGGCAVRVDLASMRHEAQTTRLFRS